MILVPLGRQATPEAMPLRGAAGCDGGPSTEDSGKERDTAGEFEALVAALAATGLAPANAPTVPATAEAGGDAAALDAGAGKPTPATETTPSPPEVQIATGGTVELGGSFDLAPSPATPDAAEGWDADPQLVARGSAPATSRAEGPTGTPQQGEGETDHLPTGASDRASATLPLRIMVHASATPAAVGALDAAVPAPEAPETGDIAPAVEGAEDTRAEADGGDDPPDAGTGSADTSGRQKPAGSEIGAPLSAVSPSPARLEADMQAIPAPSTDPADPSSRQDPATAAVAKAVHHLAEAAHHKGGGTVEIALSPEELGHVRLTIQSHEGGAASVHLSADRQDTLDLMRRHVELLAEDMRDLGYKDLSFSFQEKAQRGLPEFGQGNQPGPPSDAPQIAPGHGVALASLRAAVADSGLDIRI